MPMSYCGACVHTALLGRGWVLYMLWPALPSTQYSLMLLTNCSLLQGYDILEDMYSPKTSIANFAHDLCEKKRVHLDKFMAAMVAQMQQYVAAAAATNNAGVPVVRLVVSHKSWGVQVSLFTPGS